MSERTIRKVVVADDHPLFRIGLQRALEAEGLRVRAASNGLEAVEACREWLPDFAVLDARMPVLDGIEACRRLCKAKLVEVVLILTTYVDAATVSAAREAGAKGLVSKESDALHLISVASKLLNHEDARVFPNTVGPLLSERELQVLTLLVDGHRRKAIAAKLGLSPETVKDHTASLYAKLDASDRVSAVTRAIALGLAGAPPSGGARR